MKTANDIINKLIPDQWKEDLVYLYKIDSIPNVSKALSDFEVSTEEIQLTEDWSNNVRNILHDNWSIDVAHALKIKRVYPLYVCVENLCKDDVLVQQLKCLENFVLFEKDIIQSVVTSLIRFYDRAKVEMSDWFEDYEGLPDSISADSFSDCYELNGVSILRRKVVDSTLVKFSINPIWDEEHGLTVVTYGKNVVMIGSDEIDDMFEYPNEFIEGDVWRLEDMTTKELEAFNIVMKSLRC